MDQDRRTVTLHEITDTHAHGSYQDAEGRTVPITFTRQACRNQSFRILHTGSAYWLDIHQSEQCHDYGSW